MRKQQIYRFCVGQAEGDGSMRKELGGKGSGLAEMARLNIPVPPGFTIHSDVCRHFLKHGCTPEGFDRELLNSIAWLEQQLGQSLGSKTNPLLVSVRSGAAVSMPGMMDTVLNIGLNDDNVVALERRHHDARFAVDSFRRLLQMLALW